MTSRDRNALRTGFFPQHAYSRHAHVMGGIETPTCPQLSFFPSPLYMKFKNQVPSPISPRLPTKAASHHYRLYPTIIPNSNLCPCCEREQSLGPRIDTGAIRLDEDHAAAVGVVGTNQGRVLHRSNRAVVAVV